MFRIGEKALAYSKNYNHWIEPFTVTLVDGRIKTVRSYINSRRRLGKGSIAKSSEWDNTCFDGMELVIYENGRILHQRRYIK